MYHSSNGKVNVIALNAYFKLFIASLRHYVPNMLCSDQRHYNPVFCASIDQGHPCEMDDCSLRYQKPEF